MGGRAVRGRARGARTVDAQPTAPVVSREVPRVDDSRASVGPVIVLTYAYAGGLRLQRFLERGPDLACTAGTGILGACSSAAEAWRQAEDRESTQMSPLAVRSVRAMLSGMMTIISARTGRNRWCETAASDFTAAEAFLQVFPETRFICLHRACPDVAYAALKANPWGVNGPQFASYVAGYPASLAAAISAWWVAHAGTIADFEERYQQSCLRVRYEDLILDPAATTATIAEFLSLAAIPASEAPSVSLPDIPGNEASAWDAPGCGADFPVGQLPAGLAKQVSALQVRLGYPMLSATRRI